MAASGLGLPTNASVEGDSEHINLANGDLTMFIPALTLPQRTGSKPLVLGFTYDSTQINLRQDVSVSYGKGSYGLSGQGGDGQICGFVWMCYNPSFEPTPLSAYHPGNSIMGLQDATGDYYYDNYTYSESGVLNAAFPSNSPLQVNLPTLRASVEYEGDAYILQNSSSNPYYTVVPQMCVTNFNFTDWSGSSHQFAYLYNWSPATSECATEAAQYQNDGSPLLVLATESTDNSFYRLNLTNLADITVTDADGTVYHFTQNLYGGAGNNQLFPNATNMGSSTYAFGLYSLSTTAQALLDVPSSIVDRNGNTITITGNSNLLYGNAGPATITDTLGRTIMVQAVPAATSTPFSVGSIGFAYKDTNGQQQTVQVTQTSTQPTSIPDVGPLAAVASFPLNSWGGRMCGLTNQTAGDAPLYPQISPLVFTPPPVAVTGQRTSYSLAYSDTGRAFSMQFDGYNHLMKITYPSGGYNRYDYQEAGYEMPLDSNIGAVACNWGIARVSHRYQYRASSGSCDSEDTTTFNWSSPASPNVASVDVIDPLGTTTRHFFGGASDSAVLLPDIDVYTFDSSSAQLAHINKSYSVSSYFPSSITTTIGTGAMSHTSLVNYQYESIQVPTTCVFPSNCGPVSIAIENPTEIDEYGFDGTLLKKTTNTYWSSPSAHIYDRLQTSTVTDPVRLYTANVSFSLDVVGNIQSKIVSGTNAVNQSVSYTPLDQYGRPTQAEDALGNITKYSYADSWANSSCAPSSNSSAYLTSVTNAKNQVTSYKYNSCTGSLASVTDPNYQTTSYTYDSLGRTTFIDYPDGGFTQTSYVDSPPNSIQTTKSQYPNPLIVTNIIEDGLSRKSQTQLLSDSPLADYVDTIYDSIGRVASESNPYRFTSDPTYGVTQYFYDALDRKTEQIQPDGFSRLWWCYNGSSDVLHPQPNCHPDFTSDTTDAWVDSADEAGLNWQHVSDAAGRLKAVLEPPGIETDYSYDGYGNLWSVNQKGTSSETPRARSFTYNGLSQLVTSTNPETGTICYGYWSSGICTGGYDADGNLLFKTDARGDWAYFGHDALNRIIAKAYSDGTPAANFVYDGPGAPGDPALSMNAVGRLSTVWNSANTGTNFSYDSMGRLTTQSVCLPSDCSYMAQVTAVYDLGGNITDLTYPDGRHIQQTWDGAGRLTGSNLASIGGVSASGSYLESVNYLPDGSPGVLTLGNGVQQTIVKNNRMQIQSLAVATPLYPFDGQPYLSHSYCYFSGCTSGYGIGANNGNIWGISDLLNSGRSQGFTYDSLNRISNFSLGGSINQQYQIDSFGNMTQYGTSAPYYTFDPATNRINNLPCASAGMPYDLAGNQLCSTDQYGGVSQYTYDAESRISKINALNSASPFVSYLYGADGARVRKTNADGTFTEYVDFGGQPIAEKDETGAWTDYIYGDGNKIAKVAPAPVLHHYGACGNCSGGSSNFTVSGLSAGVTGYTIRSGDQIIFQQKQTNARAGLYVIATDNTNSMGTLVDQNGDWINSSSVADGTWHWRTVSLNGWVGKSISSQLGVSVEANTPTGVNWDSQIADVALVSTDGTVLTMFNGQSLSGVAWDSSAGSNYAMATVTDASPGTHFYVADHLGTAQMEFASQGYPVWQGQFAPYGGELLNGAPLPPDQPDGTQNHYKFTGKERDIESGLDYFGARYYASSMGRWMSPDWADKPEDVPYAKLDDPQSLNLYGYVGNNPLSKADPDGHCPECPVIDIIEYIANNHPEVVAATLAGIARASTAVEGPLAELGGGASLAGSARWGLLAGPAIFLGSMIHPATVSAGDKPEEEHEAEPEPQTASGGAMQGNGRGGKQGRLRDIANDHKASSADRGWIKSEQNQIKNGNRSKIRVPPGKNLAHRRGKEARKGYDYSHSDLQDKDLHETQHRLEKQ